MQHIIASYMYNNTVIHDVHHSDFMPYKPFNFKMTGLVVSTLFVLSLLGIIPPAVLSEESGSGEIYV